MRILIVGAGVIGSFNAARLKEAGQDVTLLARGQRLADLREHGVVLEDYKTRERTTTKVPLVERVGPNDAYDLAIVIVRRSQIPSILPMLAENHLIPSVLFLGNNAAGEQDMIEALGKPRVLVGFVNAGGERQGYVVRYVWRHDTLVLGELDASPTPRTKAIAHMFQGAGLPAKIVKDIDAHLKTHAAGVPAFAGAIYMADDDIRKLAHTPETLKLYLQAYREALRALRALSVPLRPPSTRIIEWVPSSILMLLFRRFFGSKLAVVGGQGHAVAAPDEMKELADEFRAIFRQSGTPSPASEILFAKVDARFSADVKE